MIYEFEACVLDTATQEFRRDGDLIPLEPQVFAVLEYLLANADRVVTKIELLDEVWGDRFVSEAALTSRVKLARQACGDSGREQRVIKTVHGRGYRLVAPLKAQGHRAAITSPNATTIGREAELAILADTANRVASASPATVLVCGPAGAGKSTLVADFVERSDDLAGWIHLRGRCHRPRSGPEPYFALLDALAALANTDPDLVRDTLDRVAPSWLVQLPALVDDDTADRLEKRLLGGVRQRMLREGTEAFTALARIRPTLLVLEDVHEADDCTLDLIELLAGRADPVPLIVVVTARPGSPGIEALRGELTSSGAAVVIDVGPLSVEAVHGLLQDRHPSRDFDPEMIELLHERSGGNPLFAQELLSAWDSLGAVDATDPGVEPRREEMLAEVPDTLIAVIEQTLNALEHDQRTLLEAAAVAGATFDAASVAAGLDRATAEVETSLAHMARHSDHIVAAGATTWNDGTVSTSYSFTHQLYRDAVRDALPAGRRAELHRRIGLALESRHPTVDVSVLAEHFLTAGDADRSARYLRRVGEQALGRQAPGRAASVLDEALRQCARLEPGDRRDTLELAARLTLAQARVANAGWSDEHVERHYERALELAIALDATEQEASARYGLATISEMRGDFERTEELLTPIISTPDGGLEIEAHELVACSTFHQGAFERSAANADAVLTAHAEDDTSALMAQMAEHPATSCNSWMSLSNWFLGRSDDSLERAENAVRLGERHRYALAMATQQRAMLHQLRDEPAACLLWSTRTLELDRELLSRVRAIQATVLRGWAEAAEEGRLDAIDEAVTAFVASGIRMDAPYYLAVHADALLRNGRPEQALARLADAEKAIDEATRSYFHRPEILRLRAQALAATGAIDEARTLLDDSLDLAANLGSPPLALRTTADRFELEQRAGDGEPWRTSLTSLVERYDGQVPPPDVIRARSLLAA